MSGHFSSMKYMGRVIILLFISVILVHPFTNGSLGVEIDQNDQPKIVNINHDIDNPRVNETVRFTSDIENVDPNQLTKVTIEINHRDSTNSFEMTSDDNSSFEFSISFNLTGSVRYQVFLFVDGLLADSSVMKMIQVSSLPNGKTIIFEFNRTQELAKGNFSVAMPNNELNLTLEINEPIALSITNLTSEEINLPGNLISVSNAFGIHVNNSNAITNVKLQFQYQAELIKQLGIDPQFLKLYARENGTWEAVTSEIDEVGHFISHQGSHFSDWVVASSLPTLKFVETEAEYSTIQGDYIDLPIILKNFGSYAAENVSVRIIELPGLLLNNLSNTLDISRIDPLEQRNFSWQFFVDTLGEFNVVILGESDNADGDILNIRIIVNQASDRISETTTDQTPIIGRFEVAIVMISVFVYYKRQKYEVYK